MTDWLDTPPERPDPLAPAEWLGSRLDRLNDLAELEPDWDSYGAAEVSEVAYKTTKKILHLLAYCNAEPPHLYPIVEGGIQLEWTDTKKSVEVDVASDGEIKGWIYSPITHEEREF